MSGALLALLDVPEGKDKRRRVSELEHKLAVLVMSWHPRFVKAFTHTSGNEARVADLGLSVAAVLCAPEAIITDTGSYSDIVFGLLHLLGRQYRPQLANLPHQRLWRIDPAADYGPLDRAARGRIDVDRITQHWEDMRRVAVSIHSREVSAHEVTRMISRDGNPTLLGQAIAHYGCIFKTLHILRLADDEPYRREIKLRRPGHATDGGCRRGRVGRCTGRSAGPAIPARSFPVPRGPHLDIEGVPDQNTSPGSTPPHPA
ncbi:Tn3 family transposase [Microbispora sp. NPDC046933]|uniref:Tn3 family transposase n=1 Tax=Microbispora sp. NPDC046933 TaxID=3155618 RepID=UPI0033CDC9D5